MLGHSNFAWNENEFSHLFRDTRNADDLFLFRKNRTFNMFTQCAEPLNITNDDLEVQSDCAPEDDCTS